MVGVVARRAWMTWALALAPMLGATAARADDPSLSSRVEEILRTPGYENAHWGILVVDAKDGKTIYAKNPDHLFRPASVTKLFSTAAAWLDLGPDYRFETVVRRRGEVDASGTLRGSLILVASGDPSLGGRTGPDGSLLYTDNDHSYAQGHYLSTLVNEDPLAPVAGLDSLAREVHEAGIKAISDDVLIDDRLFDPAHSTGSGPRRVSPILVNDNIIDVLARPGAQPGEAASVVLVPRTDFVSFEAQVQTVPAGETPQLTVEPVGPRRFVVRGKIPVGHAPIVKYYEVDDPASFARALLIESLRRRGVRVDASPLADNSTEDLPDREAVSALPKVASYTSPPLREYIKVILKVSQNLHASTLPLLIAAHHQQRTLSDGLRRQGWLLQSLGVDPDAVSFGGGAGGSPADLVTPRATVALLKGMAARPDFAAYEAALPILGRDGTLAKAVGPDSPARGHVRAKTGTFWVENGLNGRAILTSKALAGTIETASGRSLLFAFFLNGVPLKAEANNVSEATAAANRLLGRLAETFYNDASATASSP